MNVAGKLCVSVQKRELFDIALSELAGHEMQSQKCRLFSEVSPARSMSMSFSITAEDNGACLMTVEIRKQDGTRLDCKFSRAQADVLLAKFVAMRSLMDICTERVAASDHEQSSKTK